MNCESKYCNAVGKLGLKNNLHYYAAMYTLADDNELKASLVTYLAVI